jgi:hypothetical protein
LKAYAAVKGHRTAKWAAGAAAVLIAAVGAAPAQAACGGVKHFGPTKRLTRDRPPLAIGDSVMLGAIPEVRAVGFEVDVRGCRQISEGLRLIGARKRVRTLPRTVVIMLGTNWVITSADVRRALRIVGRNRLLGLVTPREEGGGSGSDAAVIRAAGRRYPGRVKVLDWVAYTAGHSGWLAPDGIHLGPGGAQALARLLKRIVGLIVPLRGRWTGGGGGGGLAFSVSRRGSLRAPVLVAGQTCFAGGRRLELGRAGLKRLHVSGRGRFHRAVTSGPGKTSFAGRFTRSGRARGTLRVRTGSCDTGLLHWSARAGHPKRRPGRYGGRDANGNRLSLFLPSDRLTLGGFGVGALRGTLPVTCPGFQRGGDFELGGPISIAGRDFSTVQRLPDGSTVELSGRFTTARRAKGTWRRIYAACDSGRIAWSVRR